MLLGRGGTLTDTGIGQRVDHAFHGGVAGEVPQHCVPAPALGEVAEQTVERHVQIEARRKALAFHKARGEEGSVIIKRLPVGGGARGDGIARRGDQGAERPAQIRQRKPQLRPAREQNVPPHGGQVFIVVGHVMVPVCLPLEGKASFGVSRKPNDG